MNAKSFIAFSLVTAVLVVAAIVAVGMRPAPTLIPKDRELVFGGLDARINEVSAVEVATPARTFTVVRAGDGWGIKELKNFPAKFEKVKTVLVELSQLRYLEAKTSDPARFERLQLRDVTEKGARSKRVTVRDKDGKVLAEGLMGRRNENLFGSGKGGTYIRVGGKPQTWLVEGIVQLGDGPPDWISKKLPDIKERLVKRIVVTSPKGGEVVVQREDAKDKDFKLEAIPAGKRQRGQWETNQMPKALDGVELTDIRRDDEVPFPPDATYKGRIETFVGLVVHTEAAKIGKKFWTRLSASADGGNDEVKKLAADINERFQGYVFEIPEEPGKKLTCEHVNLLEGAGINACA